MPTPPTNPTAPLSLTEEQRSLLSLCLRMAAEKFLRNVNELSCTEIGRVAGAALAEQFNRQAADAENLALLIDEAESLVITPATPEPPPSQAAIEEAGAAVVFGQCSALFDNDTRCERPVKHITPHRAKNGRISWDV